MLKPVFILLQHCGVRSCCLEHVSTKCLNSNADQRNQRQPVTNFILYCVIALCIMICICLSACAQKMVLVQYELTWTDLYLIQGKNNFMTTFMKCNCLIHTHL